MKKIALVLAVAILALSSFSSAVLAAAADPLENANAAMLMLREEWKETYGTLPNASADHRSVSYPEYVVDLRVEEYQGSYTCLLYIMDFSDMDTVSSEIKEILGNTLFRSIEIIKASNQEYNYNTLTMLENTLLEKVAPLAKQGGPLYNIGIRKAPYKNRFEGANIGSKPFNEVLGVEVNMPTSMSKETIEYFKTNISDHPAIYFASNITVTS